MSKNNVTDKKGPIFIPKRKVNSIVDFLMMTPDEVVEKFMSLPNAKKYGRPENMEDWIYIPGTRKNKALLVAHWDTVWGNKPIKLKVDSNDEISSSQEGVGIGADDRVGCYILWKLRNMGHSLILCNGEERGGKGSSAAFAEMGKELNNDHQFAIEFDRQDNSDLAFYSVATDEFKTWSESKFKGYKRVHGMYTDICELCDTICGVNASVGYRGQHGAGERLNIREMSATLSHAFNMLNEQELPKFPLTKPKFENWRGNSKTSKSWRQSFHDVSEGDEVDQTWSAYGRSTVTEREEFQSDNESYVTGGASGTEDFNKYSENEIETNILQCVKCEGYQGEEEAKENNSSCIHCFAPL